VSKAIITAGRDFDDREFMDWVLAHFYEEITEAVSGGASCAETALGELWARAHRIPITAVDGLWTIHSKEEAGLMRNYEMARYADMLIAFWDGKSNRTKHMIETALAEGVEVHVYQY
jgi:hypothetical protein